MRSARKNVLKKRVNAKWRILLIPIVLILLTIILFAIRIDINEVKQRIAAEAESQLNAEVVIDRAYFSLLPYPHITLRGVKITSPQWGNFVAAKIRIYPRLLSLLQKKVVVKRLQVKKPILDLALRKETVQQGKDIFAKIDQTVRGMSLSLDIERGIINLLRPEEMEPFFTVHGLTGNISSSKKRGVRLDLNFSSPWAEEVEVKVSTRARDNTGKPYSFVAAGTEVQVDKIRGVILELFGKHETVQTVFGIIQGGDLSRITFRGQGNNLKEALDFERNVKISGTFAHGKIMTPPGPLPLEEVSGEFQIEEAVLHCSGVDLRLGKSIGSKGDLVVGLIAKQEVFHLDLLVNAAAEDLVCYLPAVIKDKGLIRELGSFREVEGWGKGRLVLGENIKHISPTVQVKDFQTSFHHASSPGRVSLSGGRFSLQDGKSAWRIDSIIWKGFRWRNAEGGMSFGDRGIGITVAKADLCGLQCEGSIDSHAETFTHAYRIRTREGDLSSTLKCLWGKDARIEGKFFFEGDMWAEGREDPLREASEGTLYFSSQNGRIYRWTLLSQLVSMLNIIGLVQGKFPDFTQQGFPYDQFTIRGELRDGYIYLKEAVIDGPAMKIVGQGKIDLVKGEADIVVLLAPLRTIDTIMHHIPIIGKIMTGKNGVFISVPFSVKGALDDPKVTLLPPEAVGSGLWGVLKRTLQSPLEMFKSISQKKPSLEPPQAKINTEPTINVD